MKVISTTIEWAGYPVKIEDGRVFLPAFGTTVRNHSMHWSWIEVTPSDLKPDLRLIVEQIIEQQ